MHDDRSSSLRNLKKPSLIQPPAAPPVNPELERRLLGAAAAVPEPEPAPAAVPARGQETIVFSVQIPKSLKTRLKTTAQLKGVNVRDMVIEMFEEYLAKDPVLAGEVDRLLRLQGRL